MAQLLANIRATGLAHVDNLEAQGLQHIAQEADMRGLACTIATLERDQHARCVRLGSQLEGH